MKRIIAIVSVLLLVCSFSACGEKAADDSTVAENSVAITVDSEIEATTAVEKLIGEELTYEQLTYNEYENHIEITGGNLEASEVIIPEEIGGKPVTAIDELAFSSHENLVRVEIPECVTHIGGRAFDGTPFVEVNQPLIINNILCDYSTASGDVSIPDGITVIGEWAFGYNSEITGVSVPNSVTSIESHAFYHCSKLTSVVIPDSVTSIKSKAFSGCENLKDITIPSSLKDIGYQAFYKTAWHEEQKAPVIINNVLHDYALARGKVSLSDEIEEIGMGAFGYAPYLTGVEIPDGVTKIGESAFFACDKLKKVAIPESVTVIDKYAFFGCGKLKSITIPDSVAYIGLAAFEDCKSLTEVNISDTLKEQYLECFKGTPWYEAQKK